MIVERTHDIVCSRTVAVLECEVAVDQSFCFFLQQRLLSETPIPAASAFFFGLPIVMRATTETDEFDLYHALTGPPLGILLHPLP